MSLETLSWRKYHGFLQCLKIPSFRKWKEMENRNKITGGNDIQFSSWPIYLVEIGPQEPGLLSKCNFAQSAVLATFLGLDLGTEENCIIHDCGANPVSIGWAGIQPLSVTPWPRYRNGRQGRTDMRNKWSGRPLAARGRRPTAANSATARVIGMRVHSVSWQAMTLSGDIGTP